MKRIFRQRFPAIAAVLLLLALWHAGMGWMADRGIRRVEAAATLNPPTPDSAEAWRARRFCIDPDSYHWLSFARDLRASPGVRVRRTGADNAPYGREVHWAQLPIWLLAGLSWTLERAGGLSPPLALELAGRILMPAVGFLFSASVFLFLARRGRRFVAFLAAVPMAVCTSYNFHALRPDHHGFQIAFIVAMWLCLLESGMGWCRVRASGEAAGADELPSHRSARRHFVWAGVFSGLALWLGATVFTVALFVTAAGLALILLRTRVRDGAAVGAVLCPDVFRAWGVAGAATSLVFWFVEYAPASFALRLEANHPLHALCLLGTAECLRAIARWKRDRASFGWRDGLPAAAGFAAAAVLPALLVFGPREWFVPRSTAMLRLHGRFILEFRSLWESGALDSHFENLPLLLAGGVAGVLSAVFLWRNRIPFSRRGPLALLGFASLAYFLLSCGQVRWVQFLNPGLVLLVALGWAAACGDCCQASGPRAARWGCMLAGLLALAPAVHAAAGQWRSVLDLNRVERMSDVWMRMLLQRNVLLELKAAVPPGRPLRWMLPVEMAPAVAYFGAGAAVGSLYWENAVGMQAAAEFFGDPLPGVRTYEIARERGITHVVVDLERGEGDAYSFYHLLTGKSDYPGVAATVGYALARDERLESDWLHLDERLTAVASRPIWIFLPGVGRWIPFRLPLRVYAVDESAFHKERR